MGEEERGSARARRGARERECVRSERERERASESETDPNSRACTDRRVFLQAPLAMGPQHLTTQSTFCCAVIYPLPDPRPARPCWQQPPCATRLSWALGARAGARSAVGAHRRSMVCREVRSASGAAMAVAPSGPRLLRLRRQGGASGWRKTGAKGQ